MNVEHNEALLASLDGKQVVLVEPSFGRVSKSYAGQFKTTSDDSGNLGFHITGVSVAVIFFAEDVQKIESPTAERPTHLIRLKGPSHYNEQPKKAFA